MKRRRLVALAVLGLSLIFQACGRHCAPCAPTVLLREPPAPLPEDHEVALFSEALPTCEFEEIAVVRITTVGWPHYSDTIYVDHLKKAARVRGGDGVIGVRAGQEDGTALIGTVIRFSDPECRH